MSRKISFKVNYFGLAGLIILLVLFYTYNFRISDAVDGNLIFRILIGVLYVFLPIMSLILSNGIIEEKARTNESLLAKQRGNETKILYLRNFQRDGTVAYTERTRTLFGTFYFQYETINFETSLSSALSEIGHFIAVGQPSQKKDIGADRISFLDEEWKKYVLDLMQTASMIILRPSLTKGLLWELEQLVLNNHLHKVVICTLNKDDGKAIYNDFRKAVASIIKLPRFSYFRNYLFFDRENIPR
jgi:hypothetical protein